MSMGRRGWAHPARQGHSVRQAHFQLSQPCTSPRRPLPSTHCAHTRARYRRARGRATPGSCRHTRHTAWERRTGVATVRGRMRQFTYTVKRACRL